MDFCFPSSCFASPLPPTDSQANFLPLVRTAQLEDIKELVEILSCSFHSFDGWRSWLYPLFKLGVYEDLRTRITSCSPHYRCLVASKGPTGVGRSGEEIVGIVEIGRRYHRLGMPPSPYLSNLAVKPSHRRQGIARQLLYNCEQVAREWGYGQLSLHVLEDNYSARQLYLGSGYRLQRVETSLSFWLLQRPRRLLLNKSLSSPPVSQFHLVESLSISG